MPDINDTAATTLEERVAELERLLAEQAKLIGQIRTDLSTLRKSHNSKTLRTTIVPGRTHQ